jgi:hypothetical protein
LLLLNYHQEILSFASAPNQSCTLNVSIQIELKLLGRRPSVSFFSMFSSEISVDYSRRIVAETFEEENFCLLI